jgi:thioredoxin-like negative regulator of GroEL
MKSCITQSLLHSYSYLEYRNRVSDLLSQGMSSGNEQSPELTHYSGLNETRMNRLDKTIKILEENLDQLDSLERKYIWLVLAEGWCGDAAQLLPILNKIAEGSGNIELKIVFRDENEELMSHFLTNGARAVPKVIVLDAETLEIEGSWGPRPTGATDLIKEYKAQFGAVDETAKANLQLWYLHDKGLSTQEELVNLMFDLERCLF